VAGERVEDTTAVAAALEADEAVLPPIVVTEALSDPQLDPDFIQALRAMPLLPVLNGYWHRAGELRANLLKKQTKAALADTLIAQSCIDSDVPLITHDRDFRHFVKLGLKLLQAERQ
jgi:predicted nucleic acid-binding protein